MTRPLTFREVIDVLLEQGAIIYCFRCKHTITAGKDAEREHFVEKALGGDDSAANARISHKDCHAIITRGSGSTTAGTSIGRISKAKRIARTGKMAVNKTAPRERPTCSHCGLEDGACICAHLGGPKRPWPSLPMQSRPFQSRAQPWPKRKMRAGK